MQTSSPIFRSRMSLPYLVMGECAQWYRLSSLDYISKNKKSKISTLKLALMLNSKFLCQRKRWVSFFFLIVAFFIFCYSASDLYVAKEQFYFPKKGLLMKNFLNYESIVITVESLCYSFTFKIFVGSRDEIVFDEKMKNVK